MQVVTGQPGPIVVLGHVSAARLAVLSGALGVVRKVDDSVDKLLVVLGLDRPPCPGLGNDLRGMSFDADDDGPLHGSSLKDLGG